MQSENATQTTEDDEDICTCYVVVKPSEMKWAILEAHCERQNFGRAFQILLMHFRRTLR